MQYVIRTLAAIRLALSTRRDLLEILALRHQLAVRARPNRGFRPSDRLLWPILRRVWPQWRDALVLVQPATVERWHRDRFVRRWWRPSRRPGRPRIDSPCRDLIGRLAAENRLWGAAKYTANCSSSESSSQNARCRVTCENGRRDHHRPGAHLLRITLASSNGTPTCGHSTCRAMTSSTHRLIRVAQSRPTGCLGRFRARSKGACLGPRPRSWLTLQSGSPSWPRGHAMARRPGSAADRVIRSRCTVNVDSCRSSGQTATATSVNNSHRPSRQVHTPCERQSTAFGLQ
jgi:hypothetical protein